MSWSRVSQVLAGVSGGAKQPARMSGRAGDATRAAQKGIPDAIATREKKDGLGVRSPR